MSEYSFRVRCRLPPDQVLGIEEPTRVLVSSESGIPVVLSALPKDKAISHVRAMTLRADGWSSEEEAWAAGKLYMDALMLSFVRLGIGVDFGALSLPSRFSDAGLEWIQRYAGQRALPDVHGLMVFESAPSPKFVSFNLHDLQIAENGDRFTNVFKAAVINGRIIDERERLSFDLYNSSFFERSPDARFLTLVTAFESILQPPLRTGPALTHVEGLIQQTEECTILAQPEKDSLIGSLRWLRFESISRTGRSLASERVGDRKYLGRSAPDFFRYCYDLRSRLVHGVVPRASRADIGSALIEFQRFMADILCGPALPYDLAYGSGA